MSAATENVEHSVRTQRSNYRYWFYAKHHGGNPKAAMWLATISREMEFFIFDRADFHEISDDRQWLYGVLLDAEGELKEIGTWDEQVAEFQPGNVLEEPWHGYPQWPINKAGPSNRGKQKCRPEKVVFEKMVKAKLINRIQKKRLLTGRSA